MGFRRKSNLFLIYMVINLLLLCLAFIHASYRKQTDGPWLREKSEMVGRLGLSDLCLFTDARYTRHPSMADLNTPFQDYPMSFEHFPSGSLISPPPHLQRRNTRDGVSVSLMNETEQGKSLTRRIGKMETQGKITDSPVRRITISVFE